MFTFVACAGSDDSDSGAELASIESSGDTSQATSDSGVGPNDDTDANETDEMVDPEEAFARFEACMKDQGVDVLGGIAGADVPIDDLTEDPDGAPSFEDIEAAQAECEPILDEAFGSFDLSPEQEAEQADQLFAVQRCLSDQGFEIDVSGNQLSVEQLEDMAAFDSALEKCSQDAEITIQGEPGS
jgi:hypothetical protein